MYFDLSDEEKEIKARAAAFVDEVCKPLEDRWAFDDYDMPAEDLFHVARKFKEYGLRGLSVPKEVGGLGLGTVAKCLVYEEIMRSHVVHGNLTTYSGFLEPSPALHQAPEWQKEKYLYPILQDEKFFHIHISEPGAGSDAANIRTTAIRDGGHFIINGTKRWAPPPVHPIVVPSYLLCYAVTSPEKGHRGISTILVDYPTPGLTIGEEYRTHATGSLGRACDYHYKDVAVPVENMLGEEGSGFHYLMDQLNRNRVAIGAGYIGKMRWAQRRAIARAKERETFGKPLADRQAIQWMIAENEIEIEQLSNMVYKAAWLLDQGRDPRSEVAMVKAVAAVYGGNVVDRAIQIHGGLGVIEQTRLIQLAGEARVGRIAEGSTEAMKMIIAKEALRRG
ncbi:acyl-CoA dehydrogenase family protein [Sphingobium sp.]|uniref:acyl-CoA dehydrogenase family protein n=1 Tax=Sphingobium sp. TaxID=1912891 RepID=UPI0028BF1082|nr:acyl-CoA dehydrogenase family protein [Sphingobium sp.]